MEKLIIIASLGRIRPLQFGKTDDDPLQPSHLIEEPGQMVEIKHEPLREVVTDQAGRFGKSAPLGQKSGASYGEEHNLKSEIESKALHQVADTIGKLVAERGCPAWQLFAPSEIMPSLLQALPAATRETLTKAEKGDLTKLPLSELEKRLLTKH